jgi:hypothetical protein
MTLTSVKNTIQKCFRTLILDVFIKKGKMGEYMLA